MRLIDFARDFIDEVEGEAPRDDRDATIAEALEDAMGISSVKAILGSGSFGTAASLADGRVIKLTSDESEVEAGAVLTGKKLRHVVRVDGSAFIRGVNVKTEDGRRRVGVLVTERLETMRKGDGRASALGGLIKNFKNDERVWPDDLAGMSRAQQRDVLRHASKTLEGDLQALAKRTKEPLFGDIAKALAELRELGVYAIDAHAGNVGFSEKTNTWKLFDIGTSSSPRGTRVAILKEQIAGMSGESAPVVTEIGKAHEAGEGKSWTSVRNAARHFKAAHRAYVAHGTALYTPTSDGYTKRVIASQYGEWVIVEAAHHVDGLPPDAQPLDSEGMAREGSVHDAHGVNVRWTEHGAGYVGVGRFSGITYKIAAMPVQTKKRVAVWYALYEVLPGGMIAQLYDSSDTQSLMLEADRIEGEMAAREKTAHESKSAALGEGGFAAVASGEASEGGVVEERAPVIYEATGAVAEAPKQKLVRVLRWHRSEDGSYFAAGTLGRYTLTHQKVDRKRCMLPIVLSLNGQPLKSVELKAEAQKFAQAYDEIVPSLGKTPHAIREASVARDVAPVAVGEATPLVHIERDPAKYEVCLANARKLGAIDDAGKVYALLAETMSKQDSEIFIVVPLDARLQMRCCPIEVARGQVSSVAVSVADVLTAVLGAHAQGFIVVHNHPSGNASPSQADRDLTKDIEKAVKLFGKEITFVDHVIIGTGQYYSLNEGKVVKA